jgi:hypothetical protein
MDFLIATSPEDGPPMLIDRFACPHCVAEWHQQARDLGVQIVSTRSVQ